MKKRILPVLAALLAALVCAAPAWAVNTDMDYSGIVEGYDPADGASAAQSGSTEQVSLGGGMYYDRATGEYVYPLTTGYGAVRANVADGMVTTEAVSLKMEDNVSVALYRNGTLLETAALSGLTQPGQYSVNTSGSGSQNVRLMSFTIVGAQTGLINGYAMPSGFVVDEATRNGERAEYTASYVSMTEEGEYRIAYHSPTAGSYTLTVTVDHTAPVLALEAVKNGVARGPVSLADAEEGATLNIQLNGQPYKPAGDKLTRSGSYQIQITDAAGNTTGYQFAIAVYFDGNSLVFIAVLLAVAAALGIYLVRARRHLRVR